MNVFLPYPNIPKSVMCLDNKRLGKQRVEALCLIKCLRGETKGWRNHPAAKMFEHNIDFLTSYMNCCIFEWVIRGFKNTMKTHSYFYNRDIFFPPWLGNEEFHASHRSNLLRKDPIWYGKFGWTEPNNLKYVWPK